VTGSRTAAVGETLGDFAGGVPAPEGRGADPDRIPEPGAPPGERSGLMDSLAQCAGLAGLRRSGLLLRLAWGVLKLGPRLIGGGTPRGLRLRFLPLAALHRVMAARTGPETARAAAERVLRAAAMDLTVRLFRPVMARPRVATIAARYREIHRGVARHQKVVYERQSEDCFRFAVIDCAFLRALRELGLGEMAPAMCEADACFWSRVVQGQGIRFSKSRRTLALGGACCRSTFAAAARTGRETGIVNAVRGRSEGEDA
jgi:hypothetical protein